MLNQSLVYKDFPALNQQHPSGNRLIYLDSAATSQKPQSVLDAINHYYTHDNANIHRGIHYLGNRSTDVWNLSRKRIASFFGCSASEIVFMRNTTEALNMAAQMLVAPRLNSGDVVISTILEHHSNILPWQVVTRKTGAKLEFIPVLESGLLDLDWLEKILREKKESVQAITCAHVSNALGTVNPIADIQRLIDKEYKNTSFRPLFILDAAQSAPHLPLDFSGIGVDALAVSAHKMLGPMGIGALLVKSELLSHAEPYLVGGGMISEVHLENATYSSDMNERFTAGTPDVASAVGWAAACKYLSELGMSDVQQHDEKLVKYACDALQERKNIAVVGPTAGNRCGSVAFLHRKYHAHDVAQAFDSKGIAVRAGQHCTMPLHNAFHWAATTRMSFQVYNSEKDIDALLEVIDELDSYFS